MARPKGDGFALRDAPGGAVVARVGRETAFGTPLALGVVERRGEWLGVTTDAISNGQLGWIDARAARVGAIGDSIRISLSRRRLELLRGDRVVTSVPVAVGAPGSPTPTGRFAVAEKLDGAAYGSVYGCCILGLSAHQPHPPSSWNPDGRYLVAIHGGGGIGAAVSAGCIHVEDRTLRYLMRVVPLGTPVFVTA